MRRNKLLMGVSGFILAGTLMIAGCGDTGQIGSKPVVNEAVKAKISEAFPNTTFNRIAVDDATGMIVGEAGQTVLYFTKNARHVFVGDVMDLEERINITEKRRSELASVASLEAKAFGEAAPALKPSEPARAAGAPSARPERPSIVDVSTIPLDNVVIKNKGAGQVVYVVSDYNCSFCKKLHDTLKLIPDIEIREIPVGFLRPDSAIKGAAVLCAENPESKAQSFFDGSAGSEITTCTDGEERVAANSQWMEANGISGTPLMIKENGQVLNGAQPLPNIKAFLGI